MTAERGEAVSTREEFLNCLTIAKWSVLKPYTQNKQAQSTQQVIFTYFMHQLISSVGLFIYLSM